MNGSSPERNNIRWTVSPSTTSGTNAYNTLYTGIGIPNQFRMITVVAASTTPRKSE